MEATQLPLPLKEDHSSTLGALGAALAKAQGEMDAAKKDSKNPFFNSKYADLASVWDACREPLSKNGLAVIQSIFNDAAGVGIRTMLVHASGEWTQSEFVLPVKDRTAQGVGASITYGRRYALMAVAGIAPDDDDDGNKASGKAAPQEQPKQEQPKVQTQPQQQPPQSGSRTAQVRNKLSAKTATEAPAARNQDGEEEVLTPLMALWRLGREVNKQPAEIESFAAGVLNHGKPYSFDDIALVKGALVSVAPK